MAYGLYGGRSHQDGLGRGCAPDAVIAGLRLPSVHWPIAVVLLYCGCQQEPPHLVQVTPTAHVNTCYLSVRRGELRIRNGCVALQNIPPPGQAPLRTAVMVFPRHYTIKEVQGRWLILTSRGVKWGAMGETIDAPGAELFPELVDRIVDPIDQRRCPGPYWLVTPRHEEEMRPH